MAVRAALNTVVKSFRVWLVEHATVEAILSVIGAASVVALSASSYAMQFILPDGKAVALDTSLVHADAVHQAAKKAHVDMRLIDVMKAGIVRQASCDRYQVCAPITSDQAQFMFDRALAHKYGSLTVSIADASMAEADADRNQGMGPIEINDATYKDFDLDRAKPATIRNQRTRPLDADLPRVPHLSTGLQARAMIEDE
jgi:hypothetical protein